MVRTERNERVDRLEPLRDALLRKPHHEVERDVVEPGRAGHVKSLFGAGRGVQPAQAPQLVVPKRLDAVTEAVHTSLAERAQPVRRDGLGIGLESNLGVWSQVERAPARADDGGDFGGLEQRRRAAAEKYGVGGRSSTVPADLLQQGRDVPRP